MIWRGPARSSFYNTDEFMSVESESTRDGASHSSLVLLLPGPECVLDPECVLGPGRVLTGRDQWLVRQMVLVPVSLLSSSLLLSSLEWS